MDNLNQGAKKLRDWLKLEGRKQNWLAGICGVDRATVSQWVRGKWVPQPVHRTKIAEVTQGKVNWESDK